jgi:carbonic anhydrase
VQFHFHAPSEHTIDGAPTAMETHFVHQNEAGELAVIGVMHVLGAANAALEPVFGALDLDEGESASLPSMDPSSILPRSVAMYRYAGSLTTPPCSEGVRWHVLRATTTVSEEQVQRYQAVFGPSARPPQPLGRREVIGVAGS